MKVTPIKTHSTGNACFLLTEGAAFAVVAEKFKSGVFTETDGNEVLKAVYGIKTAIFRAKLKTGRISSEIPYSVEVLGENSTLNGEYQFISLAVSANDPSTWPMTIYSSAGTLELPTGCVDDICVHLKAEGCVMPKSYGTYDTIAFVSALPDESKAVVRMAYVLTNSFENKPKDSAWVFTGVRFEQVTDGPAPEPNPEDPSTIPDSLVKEEAPATMGSASEPTVEVWDKAMTETTTVTAADNVSVVNSTINTGILKATVA